MSRSYRRFPVAKDGDRRVKHRFRAKTFASRTVRRSRDIPSGKGGFRRLYCSWFISDWRFVGERDEKEALRKYESSRKDLHRRKYDEKEQSPRQVKWEWKRTYKRK